ncbi:DUF2207 domain-containing protein [Prevotella sp. P6B1]|uniref:DUF2207 family protein n=1 Tax=Prevotella sp. P6B1 TaxID=1410613 RepID=UPI00051C6DBB|nr:DUF2207 domain-containing protein [Prevotella sp. P6B1]
MKPKLIILVLLLTAIDLLARPQLHDLDIRVVLYKNGDALITETRKMTIDSEGTECYIGLKNMGQSVIKDLTVTDEAGTPFVNTDWDVNQSRSWKQYKCGIVPTKHGFELCWGLGEEGERTYTTTYIMTGLVRGYPDACALRHVFLDTTVSPKPEHARVAITTADSTMVIREDSCGIWGFRFEGELWFENGFILAETTKPMNSEAGLFLMAQFPKSMFEPTIWEEETFEQKKGEAFEGSDYVDSDDEDMSPFEWFLFILFYGGAALLVVGGLVWRIYRVWHAKHVLNKNLLWYRDVPLDGNLQEANKILNAYKYFNADYNNLMSACILKLISMGIITIETHPNRKGKMEPNFVMHDYEAIDKQPVLMRQLYKMFKDAAGSDRVLEPWELKQYMKSRTHQSAIDQFVTTLHAKKDLSKYPPTDKGVNEVFGLRKFLKEFTLLDERELKEVTLWKDYMIYATLFGIADKVIKEMREVNPAYFDMDRVAAQMADDMTLPIIYSTLQRSTSSAVAAKAAREHRASGGGGHSSWGGGGGGFSGFGGGGGVR